MKKKTTIRDVAFHGLILLLVVVILYSGHQILGSTVFLQPKEETHTSRIITRNGVKYFPRQDITTMLVMGIDRFGAVEDSGAYSNTGATDMNILLVFDEKAETCSIVHLNRDTMLEMPVLGIGGKEAGTYYGQLALAHTYGSGLDDSCQNVCKTVSNLLYGADINYYLSMNMDAVAIMNDAVGGVAVNVTDDFSRVDPTITMGQITLTGDQAIRFVRERGGVGDQQNTSRMRRHQVYLDGFVDALRVKLETEKEFILRAYEDLVPYIVTNCSANAVSGMVERYGAFRIEEVITPEGTSTRGEEFMEFYLDEEKLDEWILRLFFAPVE